MVHSGYQKKSEIGVSLVWLVLAGILPIIAFSCGMAWLLVHQQKAAAEAELRSTTRALSVAVDHMLEGQIQVMRMVTASRSLDGGDAGAFSARAHLMLAQNPSWLNIAVIDPRSFAIVASARPLGVSATTTIAPGAVEEVVATSKPLIVGAFPQGKITDHAIILLMVPVIRDGEVRYVLSVAMEQGAVSNVFAEQRLPPSWTGSIIDSGMRIAGRSRDPEQFVGGPPSPVMAEHIAAADSGMFRSRNLQGEKIYSLFSRSPRTGWSVAIGIPVAEVDGPIRATVAEVAAAGAALVVLALVLAGLTGRGIVARRRAYERAIEDGESLLGSIMDSLQHTIAVLDGQGRVIRVNEAWKAFARDNGADPALAEGVGVDYFETCRRASGQDPVAAAALAGMQAVLDGDRERHRLEYSCNSPSENRWFEFRITRLTGGRQGLVTSHTDITARKEAEDRIAAANRQLIDQQRQLERHVAQRTEELRQVAVEATLAEERERQAVAVDLHDNLGSILHVARIKLDALRKTMPMSTPGGALVRDLDGIVADSSRLVRSLVSQLRPPALADSGLVPALSWLAADMEQVFGLAVTVDDDGTAKPLGSAESAFLFRAVRELLVNVSKHAGTDTAVVTVRADGSRLHLTVEDKGIGIVDWKMAMSARKGFGLASLRDRITFLKGTMDIQAHPDGGTVVTLEMPLVLHSPANLEAAS